VLYYEILSIVQRESQSLKRSDNVNSVELLEAKKSLLPRLNRSLDKLREYRIAWQKMTPGEGAHNPGITALLRQNQDLIMKIIVLDRENEQTLLRRGLVPPRQLPSLNSQRPHFVAELYRLGGTN
jgi:hypothetical protein